MNCSQFVQNRAGQFVGGALAQFMNRSTRICKQIVNLFLNKKKREGRVSSLLFGSLCCHPPFHPLLSPRTLVSLSVIIRYGDCWFTFIYRKAEFLAVGRSFDDRSYALNLRALCILPKPLASGVVLPFSIIIIPHFCGFVKGFLKSFSKIFSSVATVLRLFQSTLLPDNTDYHHVPLVLNYALSPLDLRGWLAVSLSVPA